MPLAAIPEIQACISSHCRRHRGHQEHRPQRHHGLAHARAVLSKFIIRFSVTHRKKSSLECIFRQPEELDHGFLVGTGHLAAACRDGVGKLPGIRRLAEHQVASLSPAREHLIGGIAFLETIKEIPELDRPRHSSALEGVALEPGNLAFAPLQTAGGLLGSLCHDRGPVQSPRGWFLPRDIGFHLERDETGLSPLERQRKAGPPHCPGVPSMPRSPSLRCR